jgi:amidase
VFGHKPTFKLVGATRAAAPGVLVAADMAVSGPLARSADDLELAMRYLVGPGPFDGPVCRAALRQPTKSLRDYRVAVWSGEPGIEVDTDVLDCCQSVADRLAQVGATVGDQARPDLDPGHSSLYRQLLDAATNPFTELTHREWRMLDNARTTLRLRWREFFRNWDVVIAPIAATAALEHDHRSITTRTITVNGKTVPCLEQLFWTSLASVSYLPSTAFPAGAGPRGLPIGLQVIADAYDDLITIDCARLLSREIGAFVPPPGYED